MRTSLPVEFREEIKKSSARGGWMYVEWPKSADFFQTRGLVKVTGTMDGRGFRSSFMPLGDGSHKLPVTKAMAKAIDKGVGDSVRVRIEHRI